MPRPRMPLLRGWRHRLQLCACIERRIVSDDRCRRRRRRQARDARRGRQHDGRLVGVEHDLLRPASRGLDADRLFEGRLGGNGLRRWRVWIRRLGLSRPNPVRGEQQHDENAPHISEISNYRHCLVLPARVDCRTNATRGYCSKGHARDRDRDGFQRIIERNDRSRLLFSNETAPAHIMTESKISQHGVNDPVRGVDVKYRNKDKDAA